MTKFVPQLDNIDPDLSAKLDVLSSRGSDQKHTKSWSKARPMKQMTVPPATGQSRRKQSASSGGSLKRRSKT
jgi:hypothetical protein